MAHQFRFLADLLIDENHWRLREEELRHAVKVLRLRVGDTFEVGDGKGSWGVSSWQENSAKTGLVNIEKLYQQPAASSIVTLCLGALKHQEIDDLIPQLSEVGVDHLKVFLHGQIERSRIHERAYERWQKIAMQSVKQCKRPWALNVSTYKSIDELVGSLDGGVPRYLCSPGADKAIHDLKVEGGVNLLVGSEAGLSDAEVATLTGEFDFCPISVGGNILRAVTCALVGSAILSFRRNP